MNQDRIAHRPQESRSGSPAEPGETPSRDMLERARRYGRTARQASENCNRLSDAETEIQARVNAPGE